MNTREKFVKSLFLILGIGGLLSCNSQLGGSVVTSAVPDVFAASALPISIHLSAAPTVFSKTCFPLVATAIDANDKPVAVQAPTDFSVISVKGSGQFNSDNHCANRASQFSIAKGTSSTTLYYTDYFPENVVIVSDLAGVTSSPLKRQLQLWPGYRNFVSLTTAAESVVNQCFPVSVAWLGPQDVTQKPSYQVMFSFHTRNGSGNFYSDRACASSITNLTLAAGEAAAATVYYKDSLAETVTLGATVGTPDGLIDSPSSERPLSLTITP